MITDFTKSQEMLARALKTIPLASQTFSKSKTQYPFGVSPYFIQKAKGSKVYDVDGNEFVDFISALGCISLGYNDEDIMNAVKKQMEEGTIFSLPHPIEHIMAEKLVEHIPSAEMVRYGKNGTDATSAAVRLARAYTERDYVVVCGYHGWQDWYIGSTTRSKGVPKDVQKLTLKFEYNNIESLKKQFDEHKDQIACVIMEVMNFEWPKEGFLQEVKELCRKNGALLIFDETVTGFRYAMGGAQEYFGVTPDISTFGKGMANGYPVSAVVGRAEVMKEMEEIFFSGTFGGDCLALAASLAVIKKMEEKPVLGHMRAQGKKISDAVTKIIGDTGADDFLAMGGHPAWTILNISDTPLYSSWTIKTLFLQEMFARGILTLGSHETTWAHDDNDIEKIIKAYTEVLPLLNDAVKKENLIERLRCEPLKPLFKVR